MGIFGWSYPAGVNETPYDQEECKRRHCKCGAFLKNKPDIALGLDVENVHLTGRLMFNCNKCGFCNVVYY